MQLISALAGAGRIAQATDTARGLLAEWRRLGAWLERHLDAFVERQRVLETQMLPLRALRILNERLGDLLDRALDATEAAPVPMPRAKIAPMMTEEREWALAISAIQSSTASAESAIRFQHTAALQIDAAAYALDGLLDDLRGVMDVPGRNNVFAHQADYTEEHADTLYAAAVKAAVSEIAAPRRQVPHAA
jgi:hypothetical protein